MDVVLDEMDRQNHDKVNTVDRQSRAAFSFGQKKRNPHSPVPVDELRQASGPTHVIVADARPESSTRDQRIRKTGDQDIPVLPDYSTGGSTEECPAAVWGIASAGHVPRRTLELAGRIGSKSWSLLIDSGSTGNYIAADVCTAGRIKIEKDPHPDQLTMADGTQVETTGRVQVTIRSGGYKEIVQAKVFPGLRKPMILGIPWLRKANPQINWT